MMTSSLDQRAGNTDEAVEVIRGTIAGMDYDSISLQRDDCVALLFSVDFRQLGFLEDYKLLQGLTMSYQHSLSSSSWKSSRQTTTEMWVTM